MTLPTVTADQLRALTGAQLVTDEDANRCIAVAEAQWAGRIDPLKAAAMPDVYEQVILTTAVKVLDTMPRGLVTVDQGGDYEFTGQATSGMYKANLGIAQPILKTGGVVVA